MIYNVYDTINRLLSTTFRPVIRMCIRLVTPVRFLPTLQESLPLRTCTRYNKQTNIKILGFSNLTEYSMELSANKDLKLASIQRYVFTKSVL